MHTKKKAKKNNTLLLVSAVLFLLALICGILAFRCTRVLDSQYAYLRWQGEGELPFSQVSCFLPADGKIALSDVYSFRLNMLKKFGEASIDTSSGYQFTDCWSCSGSGKVYGQRNDGTASILAVGGNYFLFHPLKLVNGSYLSENDLMKDNILLDEDLAWLLFGGDNLEGMTVTLFGLPFRIAGVVARENDFASRKAYSGGMGLYMSYDAYVDHSGLEKPGISCYEVCLPNPVSRFAINIVQSSFPIGSGTIVENRGRFDFWKLMGVARSFASRAMHSGASYPYWENAARYAENKAASYYMLAIFFALLPEILFVLYLSRNLRWLGNRLSEDYLPAAHERTSEAIRKSQRKAWERKHPDSFRNESNN